MPSATRSSPTLAPGDLVRVRAGRRLWHTSAVAVAPSSAHRFASVVLVLGWVAWWFGCSPEPRASAYLPNVLLVSLDTLRADHLASYGYFRETAPTLMDAIAKARDRLGRNASVSVCHSPPIAMWEVECEAGVGCQGKATSAVDT